MNIKQTIKELKDNFDKEERKEIINNMLEEETDFEISDYRFIHKDNIDEIMKDELSSDTYILGCFNAWFIADITGLDCDIIEKAQKGENYELLGELMLKNIDDVVEGYISGDGYGHHFGHCDGNENELEDYYYFRVN